MLSQVSSTPLVVCINKLVYKQTLKCLYFAYNRLLIFPPSTLCLTEGISPLPTHPHSGISELKAKNSQLLTEMKLYYRNSFEFDF